MREREGEFQLLKEINSIFIITSLDGFHDASKSIARFAPTKSIPKQPARVERRKSL